jgi:hypothetical protein
MNGMAAELTEGEQARRWTKKGVTNLKALEKHYRAQGFFCLHTKENYEKAQNPKELSDSYQLFDMSEDESHIQVEKEDDILSLVISPYPYAEYPDAKLAELGITLPQGSTMEIWDAKCYCEYGVPVSALNELADTIDSVFKKLYGNADGYAVSVTMES